SRSPERGGKHSRGGGPRSGSKARAQRADKSRGWVEFYEKRPTRKRPSTTSSPPVPRKSASANAAATRINSARRKMNGWMETGKKHKMSDEAFTYELEPNTTTRNVP